MELHTLRERLVTWCDWDEAAFALASCIGIVRGDTPFDTGAKHLFWTDNAVGNLLHKILDDLVQVHVLEKRDEPDTQYRWNPAFMLM